MAYACPVCESLQADGEHLANHLAFTAMLHDDEHAEWLDERVGDWQDRTPEDLATTVVDHVEAVDHELDEHDHEAREAPPRVEDAISRASGEGRVASNPETRRIVEEAIELTEQMYEDDGSEEE